MNTSPSFHCSVWKWLAPFCLTVCCALSLRAAEPEPAPPKPPVVFTVVAWDVLDSEVDMVLNYTLKGKPRPVTITWRNQSEAFACDGSGPLVFTRTVIREGKKIEVPVVTAIIPEGMTRVLLIFGRKPSGGSGSSGLLIRVLNDSYDVFPGQSVRFLNYSSAELGGSLGEQSFSVASGGDQVVPATLPGANRLLPFRLARREAGGWKKLRSTGLPMSAGLRVLVFLVDDPQHPGRLEMVFLRDHIEPEPVVPATPLARNSGLRVN
jgi:hypothetical protein